MSTYGTPHAVRLPPRRQRPSRCTYRMPWSPQPWFYGGGGGVGAAWEPAVPPPARRGRPARGMHVPAGADFRSYLDAYDSDSDADYDDVPRPRAAVVHGDGRPRGYGAARERADDKTGLRPDGPRTDGDRVRYDVRPRDGVAPRVRRMRVPPPGLDDVQEAWWERFQRLMGDNRDQQDGHRDQQDRDHDRDRDGSDRQDDGTDGDGDTPQQGAGHEAFLRECGALNPTDWRRNVRLALERRAHAASAEYAEAERLVLEARRTGATRLSLCDIERSLPAVPATVGALRHLTTLVVTEADVRALPPELVRLPHLRELSVTRCPLAALPADIGALAASLRSLDVTRCRLRAVPASLGRCTLLESLALGYNRVRSLPAAVLALPAVSRVALDANPVRVPWAADTWPALVHLTACETPIRTLPAAVLARLRVLAWRGCGVRALPGDLGDALVHLDLAQNRLETLPDEGLARLTALCTLCLQHNALRSLPPSLGALPRLRVLCLQGNPLEHTPTTTPTPTSPDATADASDADTAGYDDRVVASRPGSASLPPSDAPGTTAASSSSTAETASSTGHATDPSTGTDTDRDVLLYGTANSPSSTTTTTTTMGSDTDLLTLLVDAASA